MDSSPSSTRSPIIASWIILIATCSLAIVPYVGFLTWVIGAISELILIILAIVIISKGATWHGIFILLASLVVMPVIIFLGPIISSMIAGAALNDGDSNPPPAIEGAAEEPATDSSAESTTKAPPTPEASSEGTEAANDEAPSAKTSPLPD